LTPLLKLGYRSTRMDKNFPILESFYKLDPPSRPLFGSGGPLAIDLFAGAGGISLGLVNAGFDVIFASDISTSCAATYTRNFPGIEFHCGDIRELQGRAILHRFCLARGELDLLIGGPPCQGFSILGQRKLSDPRNHLFAEFLRVVGEVLPKVVVIENVPGLATMHKGILLQQIGGCFRDLGYTAECAELLAAQYGVPQMRWRMFFVAVRSDIGRRARFPTPSHGNAGIGDLVPNRTITSHESAGFLTVRDAIGDLPPVRSGEVEVYYDRPPQGPFQRAMRKHSRNVVYNHYAPKLSSVNLARIQCLRPGDDWRDLPQHLLPAGMQRALRKDHTRRFRRMTWDGIARSIITRFRDPKSGEYIHPDQARTISIREASRIQSFPDWFIVKGTYTDQYDQVGNAVPPLLAKAVATEIRNLLAGGEAEVAVKSRYKIPA